MQLKIGALLWAQQTDWPALRDAAIAADRAGFDSLWVSDHLLCPIGSWRNPVYEAWATIAALGALTERATIGTLVGAIPFRNPGLVAKLAATVDHITGGRAVLGLGGAWLAREHHMHGIDFGASAGERLDRLHEAVPLIRGLLDGETVTHSGRFYNLVEAEQFPRPLQSRLPILIGGQGRRKTLRTVAMYADMWHTQHGSLEKIRGSDAVLRAHCADVGRDPATIERLASKWVTIRDDPDEARRELDASLRHHGLEEYEPSILAAGTPAAVAGSLRGHIEAGFTHLLFSLRAPFDHETIERMPEVRRLLTMDAK
ncbi:MAG: LLM class flavin-dependent oxidoreductase [Caldilineaceae bacterium]|nr:LLM class flavin-dependent oxidoreductase [Caldilineaceae bacterium]